MKGHNAMKENTYVISIFDGIYTTVYTTKETNIFTAENKIIKYHTALGGSVVKVATTEQKG